MISGFLNWLHGLCLSIGDYAMALFYARIVPEWRVVLVIYLIAAALLGSAFLAATIAETRRHKMKLHFLLGLLIPYIYPFILALRLKVAREVVEVEEEIDPLRDLSDAMTARLKDIHATRERERAEKQTVRRPAAVDDAHETAEPAAVEPPEPAEPSIFNRRYFEELAVDSSGARVGPFRLTMQNGSVFTVTRINNIQNDMASFEVEVSGKLKNIRIKYSNVTAFVKTA
ncbi:MAG: hypothetical protein PHH77_12200 [Victivallaceae bacterium]|nr:hypothetical protein [Victivallaceae bacterium]